VLGLWRIIKPVLLYLLAFTEQAVWLAEPFGYVPLADLEALANPSAAAPAEASQNEPRR